MEYMARYLGTLSTLVDQLRRLKNVPDPQLESTSCLFPQSTIIHNPQSTNPLSITYCLGALPGITNLTYLDHGASKFLARPPDHLAYCISKFIAMPA